MSDYNVDNPLPFGDSYWINKKDYDKLLAEHDALIKQLEIPVQIRTANWVIEKNDRIFSLTKERDALKAKLEEWKNWMPDDDDLRELAEQAKSKDGSYTNGLAAQSIYIGALEAKLRQLEGK